MTVEAGAELPSLLAQAGVGRGTLLAVAVGRNIAVASGTNTWIVEAAGAEPTIRNIEELLRPRWVWWSAEEPTALATVARSGVRVATCWDVAAVHRLLFGGWPADPARVWAALHGLAADTVPEMGQLGLLDIHGDEGTDPDEPVRPDGHLRPEWVMGGWRDSPLRTARWAATVLRAAELQQLHIDALPTPNGATTTARSESAADLLCTELGADGLPIDVLRAEEIIARSVGPRPRSDAEAVANRDSRDALVLGHAPPGLATDLRNPMHVRTMLRAVGVDVENTRAYRLEPFRATHPLVDALLTWRKAERIATTYGYTWLDQHVNNDGRLRGTWTGCDGAAGRMTASAGLHNLPAEMRGAVIAEPGHVFVHADLGQIEPRVLAAVSRDNALAQATLDDDLYAPVAQRLGVDRSVAKIAVLAAMYGQTSGAAGETLRAMESAYPVAMQFLRNADQHGRSGIDVRTYGGRLVHMRRDPAGFAAASAQGRYARNAVVQGAAAELFKAWAVTVRGRIAPLGGRIVLCLHDELLIHTPSEHGAHTAQLLEEALGDAARRWMAHSAVRYVAVARVVPRWSDAK